jgi:hypothetical protein
MLSTLGELELASGNPRNAVRLLQDSLKEDAGNPIGINHPFFDEIRWDLAQAYTCTGEIKKAKGQLLGVYDEETGREDQRFVGFPDDGFIDKNPGGSQGGLRVLQDEKVKRRPRAGRNRYLSSTVNPTSRGGSIILFKRPTRDELHGDWSTAALEHLARSRFCFVDGIALRSNTN